MNYEEHKTMLRLIEAGKPKEAADFIRDVHCTLPPENQVRQG